MPYSKDPVVSLIKRIRAIEIRNIKGIEHRDFQLDLIPNKPSLLVAPNGFGKSSFAAAFLSLNNSRLDLHKDNYHKNDDLLLPSLIIKADLEDKTPFEKEANRDKNEISTIFDIYVINSQLVPKAKKLKISGNTIVTPSIEVSPVILIKKIFSRSRFQSSHAQRKADFGKNGKVIPNIDEVLNNKLLMCKIWDNIDLSKLTLVRASKVISTLKENVNALNGVANLIFQAIPYQYLDAVLNLQHIDQTIKILKSFGVQYTHEAEFAFASIQISSIFNNDKEEFKKVIEYYKYCCEKDYYEEAFLSLQSTWKNIFPKEDKDRGLIIEFPKANQISNGERDIICFIAMLLQAKIKLKNKHGILIIDEVFDYLDDANLVAAQYYLTQLISDFKKEGRQIFPLIMTHLNPNYFKNFCFKDQKVYYLDKPQSSGEKLVEQLILKREDLSIKDLVSRHFLHYHPQAVDLTQEFIALGLSGTIAKSDAFHAYVLNELKKYLEGKKYDAVSVCCAVRLVIEQWTYHSLEASLQPDFLTTNKTPNKLDYASDKAVDVPDIFYLLGIIYNEAMHFKQNQDYISPLFSKLGNLTIRNMINWCHKHCSLFSLPKAA